MAPPRSSPAPANGPSRPARADKADLPGHSLGVIQALEPGRFSQSPAGKTKL